MLGHRANEGPFQRALMPLSSAVVLEQCHWISFRLLQRLVRTTMFVGGPMSGLHAALEAFSGKLRWMERVL